MTTTADPPSVPSGVQDPNICLLPLSPEQRATRLAAEYHRHRAYITTRDQHYTRTHNVRTVVDLWYTTLPHNAASAYCQHVGALQCYTYQQAEQLSNQLSQHFATATGLLGPDALDARHGRRVVALLMENCPFFLLTWLALAKLGCTVALLSTAVTGAQLVAMLRVAGARAVVVSKRMRGAWQQAQGDMTEEERQLLTVHYSLGLDKEISSSVPPSSVHSPVNGDTADDDMVYYDDDLSAYDVTPYDGGAALRSSLHLDDPMFYIFTSGTTGASKAAYLSHRRFMGAGIVWTYPMSLTNRDVYYVTVPMFHSNGGVLSACWNVGAQLLVRERLSVREFWNDVRRYGVTAMIHVGELWRYIHSAPPRPDDADHTLRVIAGNGLRADIWADVVTRFGIRTVVEHFGCTEMPAGPYIAWMGKAGSCGYIPPAVRKQQGADKLIAYNVEEGCVERGEASGEDRAAGLPGSCVEVAVDMAGECILKLAPPLSSAACPAADTDNPHVPSDTLQRSTDTNPAYKPYHGYTDPAANGARVYRHVFGPHDAYFSTGDLLRVDAEGFFFFVDRMGDTYRWKGENVATNEVADALARCAGIAQANVYGVSYPGRDGKAGMASVRLAEGMCADTMDWAALFSQLCSSLPLYAVPTFLRVTAAIAETSTRKYQKYRAAQEGFDPSRVGGDALLTLDGAGRTYRRLTEHNYAEVARSSYRGYELSR